MQMRWLLLFILFDVSNGGMVSKAQRTMVYGAKEECDAARRKLGNTVEHQQPNLRSMSICIPESAFDADSI